MKHLQVIIGLLISLACLFFVARQTDFGLLWQLIRAMNPVWPLFSVLLLALTYLIRALRWRHLLTPLGDFSPWPLFSANLIGFAGNVVLPMRLGEFIRAYLAKRFAGPPLGGVLASLVLERLFDGLTLLLITFLALASVAPGAKAGGINPAYLRYSGYSLLGLYLVIIAVSFCIFRFRELSKRLISRPARLFSPGLAAKIETFVEHFSHGLAPLSSPGLVAKLAGYSLLHWGLTLGIFLFVLPAAGLPINLHLAAMAMAGSALAAAVPSGPGFIGTMQVGIYWSLVLAGAEDGKAMNYGIILWVFTSIPVLAAGIFEMHRRKLSLGLLSRKARQTEQSEKAAP